MTTTQNCAECGTRAEPGQSFCDACGAVLSWADHAGVRGGASGGTTGQAGTSGGATEQAGSPGGAAGAGSAGSAAGGGGAAGGAVSGAGATASAATSAGDGSSGRDTFARADGGPGPARTARHPLGTATAGPAGQGPGSAVPSLPLRPSGAGPVAGAVSGTTPSGPGRRDPAAEAADTGAGHSSGPALGERPTTVPGAAPLGGPRSVEDTAPTEPIPHAGPVPNAGPMPGGVPDAGPGGPYPAGPVQGSGGEDMSDRARRLLVPVEEPEPRPAAAPSVVPVLPGRPTPQRPQSVRAPGEDLGAGGGIACPWCATPNRPDRHYCTRCAMPMARGPEAPARRPWWRRLLDWRHGETPWAGDRPRLRRAFGRILSWLGYAVVLTVLIVAAVNLPKGIQATKDHFAKRSEVTPDHISASRSFPGHQPVLVIDKKSNTWWGPGITESGEGQWIETKFDQPTRLLDLLITPGVSAHADKNTTSALPHRVRATITQDDGKVVDREITLDQGSGPQRVPFRVGQVTKVRFTIESSFLTSSKKQVAIAEIEFFGPSGNRS